MTPDHPTPPSSTLVPVRPVRSWTRTARLVAGILLIGYSWIMAVAVPVPYIRVEPGSATDVLDLVSIQGGPQYPAEGDLLFLTVSLSRRLTPAGALLAWMDPDTELRKEEDYTGGLSREEITRINLAVMEESKLTAVKVALEYVGCEVGVVGGGPIVTDVLPDRPAARVLRSGDVVVAVEGERAVFTADVIEAVQSVEPGDEVAMTIRRDGEERLVEVPTVRGDDGAAQVGIGLTEDVEYEFPFSVEINTGRVGGPSAGLAFTLAVIDDLTPGELTGGKRVAVTGEMGLDGTVIPVGGVEQKAVAAREHDAALMLVPAGEDELARPRAGDMEVVGVDDLDDALAALARIGGNADAVPRGCDVDVAEGGAPGDTP